MNRHIIAILTAGSLWGTMGFFVNILRGIGFSGTDVLLTRFMFCCIFFFVTILVKDPKLLKVRLRDLWCFFGGGVCSLLFFTYCYIMALEIIPTGSAAILLYLSPAFVMLMSIIVFKEKVSLRKIAALILAFGGCVFVSGFIGSSHQLPVKGVVYGVLSAFGYGMYSIFARFAIDKDYDNNTINLYTFLFAAAGAFIVSGGFRTIAVITSSAKSFFWAMGASALISYLPYRLYTYGLTRTEPGAASIMASSEPVVATIIGIVAFDETVTPQVILGIALVICAVILLNYSPWKGSGKISN